MCGDAAGRRPGQPPVRAHRQHGQARRALRRQIPHHRLSPVQLYQLRHRHRGRTDPVPAAGAEHLHRQRPALGAGPCQRRRTYPAALPERRRRRLVQGHRQRHLPEHRLRGSVRPGVCADPLRRPHLQDGLLRHAAPPQGDRRGLHHLCDGGALGGGQPLRHHGRGRRGQHHRVRREAQGTEKQPGLYGHLYLHLEKAAPVPHR